MLLETPLSSTVQVVLRAARLRWPLSPFADYWAGRRRRRRLSGPWIIPVLGESHR